MTQYCKFDNKLVTGYLYESEAANTNIDKELQAAQTQENEALTNQDLIWKYSNYNNSVYDENTIHTSEKIHSTLNNNQDNYILEIRTDKEDAVYINGQLKGPTTDDLQRKISIITAAITA